MVVTPTYCTKENKRIELLLQCIYWMQQQTHRDFMHVVVDDGSTDNSPELLDRLTTKNKQVLVYHKENGGASSAINFGVEKALSQFNPDFITITHSDDLLPPESLEDRLNIAAGKKAQMVYTDIAIFYESRAPPVWQKARDFNSAEQLYQALLNHKYIPYPTMIWERDFYLDTIHGYDPIIKSAEDWDIALTTARELAVHDLKHAVLHKVTAFYRIHENNLMYKNIRDGTRWKCYKMILAKHLKGKQLQYHLAKEAFILARALLPEPIKKPLRKVRSMILAKTPNFLPYKDEFLDEIRKIDYKTAAK